MCSSVGCLRRFARAIALAGKGKLLAYNTTQVATMLDRQNDLEVSNGGKLIEQPALTTAIVGPRPP